jgi:hypothetical protein
MRRSKAFILGTNPTIAFVQHPIERGRYLKVDAAVVLVECPHCNATAGEPCISGSYAAEALKYTATSHSARRDLAQNRRAVAKSAKVPAFAITPEMGMLLTWLGRDQKETGS